MSKEENYEDKIPKIGKKTFEESVKNDDKKNETSIVIPKMEVVNQRLFCYALKREMKKIPNTDIFRPVFTKIAKKDGSIKEIPRFFLAKMADDIYEQTPDGPKQIKLKPGTELFPFFPEIEDFDFPIVHDPYTLQEYTILHWTEIASYLEPDNTDIDKEK